MSALDVVFEKHVPALLARAPRESTADPARNRVVGFAATGVESGYWVIDLARRTARRGVATDTPDLVVEADGATLLLMFTGGLDVQRAIAAGAVQLRGDVSALATLTSALT